MAIHTCRWCGKESKRHDAHMRHIHTCPRKPDWKAIDAAAPRRKSTSDMTEAEYRAALAALIDR